MPDSTDPINPQALKAARRRRGMSQQQLADAIQCTKDTISRWERGVSKNVRSHLRERLCKELRVEWEKLTKLSVQPQDDLGDSKTKVSIGKQVRTSLQLVAERFDVRPRDVLELAPLLFLIVAERSLLARKRRLQESYAALEETEKKLLKHCTHLRGAISVSSIIMENELGHEEESLNRSDVFGRTIQYENWTEGDEGPFVNFVRDLVKDLPKNAVTSIDSFDGDTIERYEIADDTLRECTGISEDEEQGKSLLHYIRCGVIDFAECLRNRRDKAEAEYRQWLSNELARAEEESKVWLKEFVDSLGSSSTTTNATEAFDERSIR